MTTQETLVNRCKQGDPTAYTALYNQHATYVYNAICRYIVHTDEAEDILQESFVAAFDSLDSLANADSFKFWIKRIAVNKSINAIRRRKMITVELEPDHVVAEEEPVNEDLFEYTMTRVMAAIEALPLTYKTVFQLFAIEKIPQMEIAEMLGMSHTGVRTQYSRARNKVLELLKEEQYER